MGLGPQVTKITTGFSARTNGEISRESRVMSRLPRAVPPPPMRSEFYPVPESNESSNSSKVCDLVLCQARTGHGEWRRDRPQFVVQPRLRVASALRIYIYILAGRIEGLPFPFSEPGHTYAHIRPCDSSCTLPRAIFSPDTDTRASPITIPSDPAREEFMYLEARIVPVTKDAHELIDQRPPVACIASPCRVYNTVLMTSRYTRTL